MRITTALNHLHRLKSYIGDIFMIARISGSTHNEICERMQARVWKDEGLKRCPRWVHEALHQASEFQHHQIYQAVLHAVEVDALMNGTGKPPAFVRWQLRVDGEFVTSDDICAKRKAGDENVWKRVEGAHIWNHKPERCYGSWENTYDKTIPVK